MFWSYLESNLGCYVYFILMCFSLHWGKDLFCIVTALQFQPRNMTLNIMQKMVYYKFSECLIHVSLKNLSVIWPISSQFSTCSSTVPGGGILRNACGRCVGSICPAGPHSVGYPGVVDFDYLWYFFCIDAMNPNWQHVSYSQEWGALLPLITEQVDMLK